MKLSLSLIQSFLPPLDLPPAEIGEILTLLGIELDKIENETPSFAKVVVGEVLEVKKHPDAKNLQVAQSLMEKKPLLLSVEIQSADKG